MGLTKWLESRAKTKPAREEQQRRRQAEKVKFEQEEYEARERGYRRERLRQAEKKGRQRAKQGGGVMGALGTIGDISSRIGTGMNIMEKKMFSPEFATRGEISFGDLWRPQPTHKKKAGQAVHIHVHVNDKKKRRR